MSNLKTYAESEGLMPFEEDYFFGNLKGYSSALFVNPAGKQLTIHTCISDEEQQEKLQKYGWLYPRTGTSRSCNIAAFICLYFTQPACRHRNRRSCLRHIRSSGRYRSIIRVYLYRVYPWSRDTAFTSTCSIFIS